MSHYISIQEAAVFSSKSLQTIRRLIKTNRVKYRRQETPQGFVYLVDQNSLKNFLSAPVRAAYGAKYNGRKKVAHKEEFEPEMIQDPPLPSPTPLIAKPILPQLLEAETVPDNGVYALGKTIGASSDLEKPVDNSVDTIAAPQETVPEQKNDVVEQLLATIRDLQAQHAQDKNKLYELLENFQRRAVILEERVKQLEAPKAKRPWWRLF